MPLEHVRTFRVRYYECEAFGYVGGASLLCYMQEAAFDASAAAGYDMARYEEMKRLWLVHETDLESLMPLRYGDSVQVKTWVADFRRVRSCRMYEMRMSGSGELVARANTDWVYLDTVTRRPATIPPEMIAAFVLEGVSERSLPRERLPSAPPPPPGVFTTRQRVTWREIDGAQHVNNSIYLAYAEDCAMQVMAAHGWPPARMWSEGVAPVARRHQIEYLQPAVLDDELELATWASDMSGDSFVRHTTIMRVSDGALSARVRSVYGLFDLATRKSVSIPSAFMADFESNTAR
jgi:acyl-CoA thioester hydrolase